MRLNGLKLEAVLAAFLAVALTVFGGQWLSDRYQVERPLLQSARQVDGVRQAQVKEDGGRINLVVSLGPARDFKTTYQRLAELLDEAYGHRAGRVVVQDNRTAALTGALYELNFALQEGLATGRFRAMRAAVEKQARTLGLSRPYLWVEDGRIYLGLRDGPAVLYAVVERRPAPEASPERGAARG
jgi:hypothetical protein